MSIPLYFFVSVIASFGASVLLTEKRFEFPVKAISVLIRRRWLIPLNPLARRLFKSKNVKMQNMLKCCVCTSFWTALWVDIFLYNVVGFFLWPLTGFAAAGLAWSIFEFFNILDKGFESLNADKKSEVQFPELEANDFDKAIEESEKD